jgi:hypothetical protein
MHLLTVLIETGAVRAGPEAERECGKGDEGAETTKILV